MIFVIAFVLICICCFLADLASSQEKKEEQIAQETKRLEVAQQSQIMEAERLAQDRDVQRNNQLAEVTRKLQQQIASKRPEAFKRLFAEEFPGYSQDITYAKSEEILRVYDRLMASELVEDTLIKYQVHDDMVKTDAFIQNWFADKLGPIVSVGFHQHAKTNAPAFLLALSRVVKSSATLAAT